MTVQPVVQYWVDLGARRQGNAVALGFRNVIGF
ncbi:MAG: hypothetical protein DMG70_03590 [Acidobacteria bacterium]|nr:MAG: hypothetical protein DMG70_03590 [Acidobacteriota bacterium]PYY06051.1 MAG: hypothetical protein DMG69_24585 [Acidobacteriota bacterium]